MIIATGYFKDQFDPNDKKAENLLFGAEAGERRDYVRPKIVSAGSNLITDLRAFNYSVLNQGQIGSCVVHAIGKQAQVSWNIEGWINAPLPNLLALFWQSRKAHGAENSTAGTYPRFAYKSLQQYGFCKEDVYPYDTSLALKPVPPRVYQASYDQSRQIRYYRIGEDPETRRGMIVEALSQLRPVALAIQVDAAFADFSRTDPWTYSGKSLGGHYVLGMGHSEDGILILNSWGSAWGNAGYRVIRWETILDSKVTTDPYVTTFVPKIQ